MLQCAWCLVGRRFCGSRGHVDRADRSDERCDISQMSDIQIRSWTYLGDWGWNRNGSWPRAIVWLWLAAGAVSVDQLFLIDIFVEKIFFCKSSHTSSCLSNYPSRRPLLCSTFFSPMPSCRVYIYFLTLLLSVDMHVRHARLFKNHIINNR
jgi:hypothetical protein